MMGAVVHTTPAGLVGDRLGSVLASLPSPGRRANGVYLLGFVGEGASLHTAGHLGGLRFSLCPSFCGKLSPFGRPRCPIATSANRMGYRSRRNLELRAELPAHDDNEKNGLQEGSEAEFDGRVAPLVDPSGRGGDPGSSRGQQPTIPYGLVAALASVGSVETANLLRVGLMIACPSLGLGIIDSNALAAAELGPISSSSSSAVDVLPRFVSFLGDLDAGTAQLATSFVGPVITIFNLLFILRIIMSWYPGIPVKKFPFFLAYNPTEPVLGPTRRLIPPVGGVDVAPVIWVAAMSFANEILLGKQGLLVLLSQQQS